LSVDVDIFACLFYPLLQLLVVVFLCKFIVLVCRENSNVSVKE
jgi:hypothetical protein